ncbi:MerR family transcriptional regulator [Aeromicrobium sp. CTD01-1L150]|uniref:MerR family transcriptional regulator n=1 Tax=Aeromicrobium sp. CTD01-1L150 TaxID=3341830 RepID=UPI0035C06260
METQEATHTVGQLARLAGVTVRTLHHYGDVGLLEPSGRSAAGYRLYDADDVDRLTRILYYRDLGFGLDDVAALLDGDTDTVEHLRHQHRLLTERLERVRAMVTSVEREMEAHMSGIRLTPQEQLEVFGETWDPAYQAEAEERWGDTPAWEQSQERVAHYTKQDWIEVKAETDALVADAVAAFEAGVQPGSDRADAVAERHRANLNRFYDADHSLQRQVAALFTEDERFAAEYDRHAPGLARWLREVIEANADKHT